MLKQGKNYRKMYRAKYKTTDSYKNSRKKYKNSEHGKISIRKETLKRKYGISLEDYDTLYVSQNGLCKICGTNDPTLSGKRKNKYFCVDHDILTGKIRGLLCYKCNLAIGYFSHSTITLQSAINYLCHA